MLQNYAQILKLLIGSQLTTSHIAKSIGVNYQKALEHLEALEAEGVLTSVKFGVRIRFYKYNEVSPIAVAIRKFDRGFLTARLDLKCRCLDLLILETLPIFLRIVGFQPF